MNINLARLARHLAPDVAVIDGVEGLQGNGPMGTDAVDFGIAAAGADVYATDAVMTAAMGFDPASMGTLHYASLMGDGVTDLAAIDIVGVPLDEVRRVFKPHETTDLQLQWHREDALTLLPN